MKDGRDHDAYAGMRYAIRTVARVKGEWAGIPMPLETHRLVIEPSYPYAKLSEHRPRRPGWEDGSEEAERAAEREGWTLRASWWSTHRRSRILVMEDRHGRVEYGLLPGVHHLDHDIRTLGAADAWGVEQENTAMELLASLVRFRAFKQYVLTGMFLETSPRSGITYLFRRLKPTVALTGREPIQIGSRAHRYGGMRILAALCLHPIGYYEGSWAGAMCPTDDVIAHLMLMRGDTYAVEAIPAAPSMDAGSRTMRDKRVQRGTVTSLGHGGRYRGVFAPDHPRADGYGYVPAHIAVVEKALGKRLPESAVVHHVNEDKADNRRTNLVACQDQNYHLLLHVRLRALRACGNPGWRRCPYCKRYDDLANMRPHHSRRRPNPTWYHLACNASYRRERGYSRRRRSQQHPPHTPEAGL